MSTPQPQNQQFAHNPIFDQSNSNHDQWNGSAGAVRSPNEVGADATGDQNNTRPDAIREGKQKAKEAMAAAGLTNDAAPSARDGGSNGVPQSNGAGQLSRKRSRDGTRLPLSQAGSSSSSVGASAEDRKMHDEALLDRYVQRDLMRGAIRNDHDARKREFLKAKEQEKEYFVNELRAVRARAPSAIYGSGYIGYGNGTTDGPTRVTYSQRAPPKSRRSGRLTIPRKDNAQQAEQHEELVPIRLDIELDKLRLRDTFTWNLHEKLISQDMFTEYLLEDLKIPNEALGEVARQVRSEMHDQIHNYYPHIIVEDGPLEAHRPYSEHKDDEMRILIKLNITIGRITLVDQFEWDINNPLNSPEEFARSMAWENALSGEFTTAIAHSIREQSQLYTKSLYLTNHCFDGRPIEDPDIRDSLLPGPIYSAFRPHQAQKDWAPFMFEMTEAEFERTETSMMREHRAQKRQLNRRGGPALPDLKDRQRTVRSLIVHSVIPGAVESMEMTGIPKTRRSGRGGRRPGARVDGDVDSEDLDSDGSEADSPAPSVVNTGTTARTRGMRGAASAAQAAMRATLGRSVTPDPLMLAPVETRTTARRSLLREGSVVHEDESLIVKLKIGKAKLKTWWEEYRARKRASEFPLSGYASLPPALIATPVKGAAVAQGVTPKGTPALGGRSTSQANGAAHTRAPSRSQSAVTYDESGRVFTDHWPTHPTEAPPPPPWLATAIASLRAAYPTSDFDALMRPYALNATTLTPEKLHLEPGAPAPEGVKLVYAPRIKCNDCPGKLYTALSESVREDFEVHLRNRGHREKVEGRLGR